jgi:ribosomal 30S subunit maturation factor RimM
MIPLLKEFITKIDVKNKKIDVKLIEGLIEDDEV